MADNLANSVDPNLDVSVTVVKAGETDPLKDNVIRSNAADYEDEFKGQYGLDGLGKGIEVIEPPHNIKQLEALVYENSALSPCINAMVTNVDGTGFVIEASDADRSAEMEKKIDEIKEFFNEPWPGESFITQRKKIRRNLEATGMAFLEALRDLKGNLVFTRVLDTKMMRIVKLDKPTIVDVEVNRGGSTFTAKVALRERRFVQRLGSKNHVYFKEFGASRDLNRKTGEWAKTGEVIPAADKATEVIMFKVEEDVNTPYGLPRWIPQTPSVLGARKAEEHNLSFFDSGGVPPIMIFVQGGVLGEKAVQAIQNALVAKGTSNHRAAVVEVQPSGGSIDSTNTARVSVERFGSERQKDSMFESYDDKCEGRVRGAFRLPPLFVGKSDDYNYATANASYTVAEAQVFQPERFEFDEVINLLIMPELVGEEYKGELKFRSLPLSVKDVEHQLKALDLVSKVDILDKEGFVNSVNQITNTEFKVREGEAGDPVKITPDVKDNEGTSDDEKTPEKKEAVKSDLDAGSVMAQDVATMIKSGEHGKEYDALIKEVVALKEPELSIFKSKLAAELYVSPTVDLVGVEEIAYRAAVMTGGEVIPEDA